MIEFNSMNMRIWARLGTCGAFGQASLELPGIDDRVVMLTSDLCMFSGLERFKAKFPDRLYNFGIAEQNMVGAAGGFAREGFIPFATTYGTFASMRCADQVKVNMGYMNLPIKLVGLTSGFAVSALGATHMSLEDVAVMRSIPNMTVISPADCASVIKATMAAVKVLGPVYLRLTGNLPCLPVYKDDFEFTVGRANVLREGDDVVIIGSGNVLSAALKAAEKLAVEGVSASVVDMHTIKPLDLQAIDVATRSKLLVTVEEHSRIGGLGSAVAEVLSERSVRPPHLILGTDDHYPQAGSYTDMMAANGLTADAIYEKISRKLTEMKR